jgi:3',5'-nucleoside bisphosphate phosphatase
MRVDLHIHSQASDGTWTPEQLVEHVCATGIELFAAIDHDSVASVAACETLARRAGIHFLRGVEICSTLNGNLYHILAYGIDPANASLLRLLDSNQQQHDITDIEGLQILQRDNFPVSLSDFEIYKNNPARGGWKALNYLIDRGLCTGVDDCFNRLFGKHRPMPFPVFPSPAEVLPTIAAAGGVPILAHPGAQWINIEEEVLEEFRRVGIRGLECYTSYHNVDATRRFVEWCRRHDLLITGGSDCHGDYAAGRKLGVPSISLTDLRLGELETSII